MTIETATDDPFTDLWPANARFADGFHLAELSGIATRHLTVVTCMDTRIDPLAVLGLEPGDAKIVRTAGARVTPDVLHSLVFAVHLLGGTRVLLMPHTDCGLLGSDDEIRIKLAAATGRAVDDPAIAAFDPYGITDWSVALARDVARIRSHPLLGPDVVIGAGVYDVHPGRLDPVPV